MPLAEHCRAQGLSVQNLCNARYEFSRQGRRSTASNPPPKKSRSRGPFVAVQMARSAAVPEGTCRVHMKDVMIEFTSLPSPAWLVQLAMGAAHAVP